MKHIFAAALLGLFSTSASAVTLTFSGDICNGGSACSNNSSSLLDQSYGDIMGVDLTYDRDNTTADLEPVFVWSTGYEEFSNAIWTDVGDGLSVTMNAETGYEVTLNSIGIAPYQNRSSNTLVRILDLATNSEIFNQDFAPISTDGSTTISPAATSQVGFQIIFGPDAYNSGIGSLSYDARLSTVPAAVPLPATGLLLLAGLGGVSAARRRHG